MQITGSLLIGRREVAPSRNFFQAVNPATQLSLLPQFSDASTADVNQACELAAQAFAPYRSVPPARRADLLERIAEGIEALGPQLVERVMAESGLPMARLEGERNRTTGQLRLFAELLRSGQWQSVTLDSALPDRRPARRPDLRMQHIAVGPVAVFGASNFPLAFSVAGGDTAAALAAGCPVVVKAHPAHPGTSELVGRVVQQAVQACGLPEGVFSLIGGASHSVGEQLVVHPAIQAVGFTGSRAGGLALCRIAQGRKQPIPVYAEMSSVNPMFLLPAALASRSGALARDFVESLTLGVGQFCTNPGLVMGIEGTDWKNFVAAVGDAAATKPAGTMLTRSIHRAFHAGIERLHGLPGVACVARGNAEGAGYAARAHVFATDARQLLSEPELQEEIFGPVGLLVRCRDLEEMVATAEHLDGQLTATLHLDETDRDAALRLLPVLERKAGRILVNGFPTGVEVAHAMVHGGPFPASSDGRATSVGTHAIHRFLRPVCYQDLPEFLLPPALQDANPMGLWRTLDGRLTAPV